MTSRKRRRHTPDQIIRKLAEGHKQLAAGKELDEMCRLLEIAESTWHRWLAQYGGMKASDVKRLKEGAAAAGPAATAVGVACLVWVSWLVDDLSMSVESAVLNKGCLKWKWSRQLGQGFPVDWDWTTPSRTSKCKEG